MNYWNKYKFNNIELLLIANEQGLWYVGINNANLDKAKAFAKKYKLSSQFEYNLELVDQFWIAFHNYFENKIDDFSDLQYALYGSKFDQKIWREIQKVKFGERVTYSELAIRLNMTSAVRAVASAVARNPLLLIIPCHRIISKNNLSIKFREGAEVKKYLLDHDQQFSNNFK